MTLRRILLAFYSLLLIAACGGLIGLVWNEDQKLDIDLADGDFNLEAFVTANDTWQVIATVVLALVILFGLWTLLMSLLPAGGARSRHVAAEAGRWRHGRSDVAVAGAAGS
jgi:hypothetical protein